MIAQIKRRTEYLFAATAIGYDSSWNQYLSDRSKALGGSDSNIAFRLLSTSIAAAGATPNWCFVTDDHDPTQDEHGFRKSATLDSDRGIVIPNCDSKC